MSRSSLSRIARALGPGGVTTILGYFTSGNGHHAFERARFRYFCKRLPDKTVGQRNSARTFEMFHVARAL